MKTGVGALVIALAFSLAAFSPAHASETEPALDASGIVAAQVDTDELEAVADAFDSGDAESAVELAAIVAPQYGVDLDDAPGVEITDEGVLVLDDGSGLNLGMSIQGSDVDRDIVDGAAVATGVDTDLDVVSRATNDGAQILAVLGSKNAPNKIDFDLDLPEGAKLTPQADGSILITAPTETHVSLPGEDERIETAVQEILGTDALTEEALDNLTDEQIEQLAAISDAKTTTVFETLPVAEIETPWAIDANGNPVTTNYELNGTTLTQTIETNADTAYPVVADPSAKAGAGQITACSLAITGLAITTAFSAAKILKIKKYLKAAGGVKPAVNKMLKSYGKYKTAVKKAKSKNKKPPKLAEFMSKDLKNLGAALSALAAELVGINTVRKACFAW